VSTKKSLRLLSCSSHFVSFSIKMFIQSFDQSSLRSPSEPNDGTFSERLSLEMTSISDNDVSNDDVKNNGDDDNDVEKENSEIFEETDLPPLPRTRDRILTTPEEEEDDEDSVEDKEHFDDWFEKDIQSDSADEQFEENIVIVDPEYTEHSESGDCLQEGFHSDMIPELLNEAMCDTDDNEELRPRLRSSNSVEETLKQDDHFFKKDS